MSSTLYLYIALTLRAAVLSSYPEPAEPKLAPRRRFFPDAWGLKYAGGYFVNPRVSAAKLE